ncbi:MAG: hypothetical protein HY438_02020 [DPANN group archaeon]|nr:hypothetical protein [DPANN group archaeon]
MGKESAMFDYAQSRAVNELDTLIQKHGGSQLKDKELASILFNNLVIVASGGFARIPKEKIKTYGDIACAVVNFYTAIGNAGLSVAEVQIGAYSAQVIGEKAAAIAKADRLAELFQLTKVKK